MIHVVAAVLSGDESGDNHGADTVCGYVVEAVADPVVVFIGYLLAVFIQIILFVFNGNEGRNNLGADAVLINVIVISVDGICTLAGYLLAVFIQVILTVIIGDQRAGGQFACSIGIEGIADPGICGLLAAYHGIV